MADCNYLEFVSELTFLLQNAEFVLVNGLCSIELYLQQEDINFNERRHSNYVKPACIYSG